ncbi:MAG: hypothetical protein OHK0029_42840 [Armatimonadaceae bacterium]
MLARFIPSAPPRILSLVEAGLLFALVGVAVFLWTAPMREEKVLSEATFPELLARSKADTENPRVFYYLGLRLHQLGHDGPARAALERAATLDTENEDIWLAWAAVSARFGQDEEPFGVLSTYLETHPKSVHAHLALALLYQQVEAYRLAYESAEKAAQLDAKNTGAWRVMASTALELRRYGNGLEAVGKAIALEPDDWRNHYLRGNLLAADNKPQDAQAAFEKAVSLAPEEPQALTGLGKLQLANATRDDEVKTAAATLEKSLKIREAQGEAWRELGRARLRLKQYEDTRTALVNAARYSPADEAIAYALRQLSERTGDTAGAARYATLHERLLNARMERLRLHSEVWQNPKQPEPRLAYARFLAKGGDWRGAINNYRRLLSLPILPDTILQEATKEARALLDRYPQALVGTPLQLPLPEAATTKEVPTPDLLRDAAGMVERGRYAEAEQAYKTVLSRDPQSAEAYEGLGLLYDAQDQVSPALEALQRATTLNPALHKAQYALSGLYYESGFDEEAAQRMEKVLQQVTDKPEYWHALGMACLRLEAEPRRLQGVEAFRKARALKPGDPVYLRDLAAAEERVQQFDAAETHYREVLALKADDVQTMQSLADLLTRHKPAPARLNEAAALAQKAQKLAPQNPIVQATLGSILLAQNKPREAIPYLEEAVTRNPSDEGNWYKLHRAYEKLGNKERSAYCLAQQNALREFREKLDVAGEKARMSPENPQYRLDLARLYVESGNMARAINQYQVCLRLDPKNGAVQKEMDELTARLKAKGQLPPMQAFDSMVQAAASRQGTTPPLPNGTKNNDVADR